MYSDFYGVYILIIEMDQNCSFQVYYSRSEQPPKVKNPANLRILFWTEGLLEIAVRRWEKFTEIQVYFVQLS